MNTTTREPRVPFGDRYGWRDHSDPRAFSAFASRHTHAEAEKTRPECEPDQRFRCACPGSTTAGRCCHRATAEDRLCDACRDYCLAIDHDGNYHRFIDDRIFDTTRGMKAGHA